MKKIAFLLAATFAGSVSMAQLQVGVFGGISNYQGDLTDKLYRNSKVAYGLSAAYQLTNRINVRAGFTFGAIAGADSLNGQEDLRLRNLSFQSRVSEFSVVGEFNSFDMSIKRWSPYVFAGLAVYRFNPYTFDTDGSKVFLRPLSTEGQGLPGYDAKTYSQTQLAIPFGGGIKFQASDKIRLALEIGLRKTFTDYLDDVSTTYADPVDLLLYKGQQSFDFSYRGDEVPGGSLGYPSKGETRGGSKYKDYYYFSGLHLHYIFDGSGRSGKNGTACPTVF